jgi:hypothetical protein
MNMNIFPPASENTGAEFNFSLQFSGNERKYHSMEVFRSLLQFVKENILYNPITWIIAAVVLWIIGGAFLKAWRGKDEDEE